MWWRLLHDPEDANPRLARQSVDEARALEEYNRWLGELHAEDRRRASSGRPTRSPGAS